jgi:hypothetical protein
MSDNLIPISDEQAKLGQEIVKAFRGLGSFLAQALGSTPEDLIGYLGGDWLRFRRAENIARLLNAARERLAARGVDQPQPASLSVALPILRGGADEDRDVLVDLWARLLANAMDPHLSSVRHQFISAVQAMDPMDGVVLDYIHIGGYHRVRDGNDNEGVDRSQMVAELGATDDDVIVSLDHLASLGLLEKPDPGFWRRTAFGRAFMRACYPEGAKRS